MVVPTNASQSVLAPNEGVESDSEAELIIENVPNNIKTTNNTATTDLILFIIFYFLSFFYHYLNKNGSL